MRARGQLGSGKPVPSASSCEVRRSGGGQRREAAPQRRGRACSLCPSRGSCGGGRRKPRAGPRADGAAPPLNGCGSGRGASTASRPVLLAGAAGPARPPPPSLAVPTEQRLQRQPRAAGNSRRDEPQPARRRCRPGVSARVQRCRDLPGARHCRDRRLWQSLTGQHLPVGASLGVRSQLPALGESGGGLEGLRPPRCSGNCRRWGKENKQAASVWSTKRADLFLLRVRPLCFYFAYSKKLTLKSIFSRF